MGGFDAVTRATANHGLHRGSFQTMATVYDVNGKSYELAGCTQIVATRPSAERQKAPTDGLKEI
jgi:hypothetical protein